MKIAFSLAILAGMLAFLPGARGADQGLPLNGTWTGAFDFQGTSVPLTFHFTQAAGALTGAVEGLPTTPAAIQDGTVANGKLSFWVNTDYQGQTYKLVFTGQLDPQGALAVTLGTDDGSWSADLTARKSAPEAGASAAAAPDVSGTWKGSFDFQGTAVPVVLQLVAKAGVLTGTLSGMDDSAPDKPLDIQEGTLDGKTLSFWVNAVYQGTTYKIDYKGTLTDDGKIQFALGTEDGSWSSGLTAARQ